MIQFVNATILLPKTRIVTSQTDGFQSWFSASVQNSIQAASSSMVEGMNTDMELLSLSKELSDRIKKEAGDSGDVSPDQIKNAIPRDFNERSMKSLNNFMSKFLADSTARSVVGARGEFSNLAVNLSAKYLSLVAIPTGMFNFINDFLVVMARNSFEENGMDESLRIDYLSSKLTNVGSQVMNMLSQGTVRNTFSSLSLGPKELSIVAGERAETILNSQGGIFGVLVACFSGFLQAY